MDVFFLLGISACGFLQYFNTVGWVMGSSVSRNIPVLLFREHFVEEHMEEEINHSQQKHVHR